MNRETSLDLFIKNREISTLYVPETILRGKVRHYFYNKDLLKYSEGGYSFTRISAMQFLIGIASVVLQLGKSQKPGNIPIEGCPNSSMNVEGLMPIVIILLAVGLFKMLLFNTSLEKNFKKQYSVSNLIMLFMGLNLILYSVCFKLI